MNELKIECGCGQHYKFDVEPAGGQMPFPVACPNCGADGTAQANLLLAQTRDARVVAGDPVPAVPGLRLSTASVAPPAITAQPPQPSRYPASPARATTPVANGDGPNYLLGTAGALAAGLISMLAWYWLIKLTGYEIGYAAWGIGALVGFGSRLLSNAGNARLGVIAGACAFVAVLGGEYLNARSQANKVVQRVVGESYQERLNYARDAMTAQTDEEVKALLIKYEENPNPTAEDISEFRKDELPDLKQFAANPPSRAQFEQRLRAALTQSSRYQWLLLKNSVGLFTLLWLFLGVGTAYRIGAAQPG